MIDLDHLTTLTDAEARDLLARAYAEVQRRDAIAKAPTQAEALAAAYAAAIGRKDGDPYQPVTGAHDAYPPGSVVEGNAGEYHARWLGTVSCHPRRVDGHRPRLSRAN